MAEEFETVELEYSEEDIVYYIFDEDGNEIGFALEENGAEVEYYYDGTDPSEFETVEEAALEAAPEPEAAPASKPASEPEEPVEHGYLYKLAQIAGHEGNKARKKAGAELGKARDKAKPAVSAARSRAEAGLDKARNAAEAGGKKLKEKKDEYDLGITREDVSEATADLNAIAKEGAATAKELKETYDDIMDSFGAFLPKSVRRKLP